jgi:hypothetical protein
MLQHPASGVGVAGGVVDRDDLWVPIIHPRRSELWTRYSARTGPGCAEPGLPGRALVTMTSPGKHRKGGSHGSLPDFPAGHARHEPAGMPAGGSPGWAGRHRVARDPAHRVRYPRGTCGTPAWPAVRAVVHDAVVAAAGRGRAAGTGAGPSEHLREVQPAGLFTAHADERTAINGAFQPLRSVQT